MRNEIQVGRFNAILHKVLGMGDGAPAPVLATEIFPTIQLEGDRPEWAFLGGVRNCSGYFVSVGQAGVFSHVGIRNPTASSVGITVRTVHVHGDTGNAPFAFSGGFRRLSTIDVESPRYPADTRWSPGAAPARTVGHMVTRKQAAATGNASIGGKVNIGHATIRDPFVILPGWELMFWPEVVNKTIYVYAWWSERTLDLNETR